MEILVFDLLDSVAAVAQATTKSLNDIDLKERTMSQASSHASRTGQLEEVEPHSEGMLARAIEDQTAKLPSDVFLWAALGAIGGSLLLCGAGKKEESLFVGQWVPTLLILGLYNKLVKVAGSDRTM